MSSPTPEERLEQFVKFIGEQESRKAQELRLIFIETICPRCWGKRPPILELAKGAGCNCHGRLEPDLERSSRGG